MLKLEETPYVDMNRMESVTASYGIVRRGNGPVSAAHIELNRTDGLMVRTDEYSAACRAANFSVQRESEQRKDQERFHVTEYGAPAQIVCYPPAR